ncbi:phosphate ABC transporter substrate-binding protein [Massilia antarctica]|uniref:phosphate ABC transporter substrate-binding protein n=1 Tax=Massilia antarctica TaxID=2765360 RepID=UPI0006BB86D9|nr:phosphate ABC transporter substrate-binding protein [Massilia sp. H27-R4]MCY0915607.1 phosphate ABC transporter substrate-binding protein [Massilia sp. H27-R4]CUI04040.1 ABC-type phosphate transport system, periplasmic component [Janthinobacterium sp. CG23_2]CUU27826.1 ABC-type phosphate transport system, periplasmic component [Janthinobacterium sp. CG23_2]
MNTPPLRRLLAACALALLACQPLHAAGSDLVVIVSAKSPVASMRADQVADIFLGQAGTFPDGAEAVALDQRIGTGLRDEFYARVTAKTPALLKAYWTKMIFTGRGQPPQEAPDSATVRRMVADNPALIGYIDKAALDHSVKAVLVVR